MAFNEFRKGSTREMSNAAAAPRSGGGGSALTAFIDQGSEFSGKVSFKDTVRIDGRFEGEIQSENTLIVGETGAIAANISSETVVLSGEVHGDVEARTLLHLHKTARLTGNVKTKSLVIEEGAAFNGQVQMIDGQSSARPTPPAVDKPAKSDASSNAPKQPGKS